MKVVLLEDVESLGGAGEVVEVADGYARNVLFPKGMAATATDGRAREATARRARAAQKAEEELKELQRVVELVDRKTVHLRTPVGPEGKLHGTVTADDIAREIERLLPVRLPPKVVRLEQPITEPGERHVTLEFPHGLEAGVTVVVEGITEKPRKP